MKKICYLIIICLFTGISLNASVGGVLVWNRSTGEVDAYFLHFKYSTEENDRSLIKELIQKQKDSATAWIDSCCNKCENFKDEDLSIKQLYITSKNKGYWAIVLTYAYPKCIYHFGIGYGETKTKAFLNVANRHPGETKWIIDASYFDVSSADKEHEFVWTRYGSES